MISVVIPAYNEEKYIADTLKSVIDNASPELLEIIVVNNASTDNTAAVAKKFERVRVVDESQKGLTRARQAGLLAAKGELLSYIDADTRVSKKWFGVLSDEFQKDKGLVCLSGPYDYYDLSGFKNFWVMAWNRVALALGSSGGYVIMGGNFTARRQALIDAGGFDKTIEFYGEDTDIARRLHKLGKVKFTREFKVGSSARRLVKEGIVRTGIRYFVNYWSVVVLKRPVTSKYNDIR